MEDGKSSITDVSEECHCNHDKYPENPKPGILKHKNSSTNRIMAKYIKSGMDQVASFIVESAIRFGKEHGVVVPDKNAPNVYEIMPPKKPYIEKNRKIKFNLPEKMLGYEDAKKVMWRSEAKNNAICSSRRSQNQPEPRRMYKSKSSSLSSKSDSLEDILPLLEDLKNCRKIVSSELDIGKLTKSNKTAEHNRKRERTRKKYRALEKRYKSVGNVSKASEEGDYKNSNKPLWKKCKRDSLELGRQRLRPATCPRQPKNLSPSPY